MPKVSVLLTNYNGEKHLDEAISSVLAQTYTDFEFIIIDDASTDSSKAIIDRYKDVRIQTYYANKNRNIAYSLNQALIMSTGEYIARIDSDDIWEADKLEVQLKYLEEHPECGVCFTKVNIIDGASNISNTEYADYYHMFNDAQNKSQKEWIHYFFYQGNCLCHPSAVIRRSALEAAGGKYHLAYVPAEDYELWTRIIMRYPIYIIEDKLVRYRWEDSENKISGNKNGKRYAFPNIRMLVRKKMMENISDEDLLRYFKEDFVNPDSISREELECEKAQILLNCAGEHTNFLGLEKYDQILTDEKMLHVLEDNMDFCLSEYYKEYRVRNFDAFGELDEAKREIKSLKAELKSKQQELEHSLEEIEQLQFVVRELMSSTSWKVTEPFRKTMRVLKRK